MFYADEGLDFARLAGLLAKSQNSCRDLSGDLAGDLAGRLAFLLLGLSDEVWRRGRRTRKNVRSSSVSNSDFAVKGTGIDCHSNRLELQTAGPSRGSGHSRI